MMRRIQIQRITIGVVGMAFLAAIIESLVAPHPATRPDDDQITWLISRPGMRAGPFRTAMRQAGYWRANAVQLADDEVDEARASLQCWDPAAPFDQQEERQRALVEDRQGSMKRALTLLEEARRLASTPEDLATFTDCLRRWQAADRPGIPPPFTYSS